MSATVKDFGGIWEDEFKDRTRILRVGPTKQKRTLKYVGSFPSRQQARTYQLALLRYSKARRAKVFTELDGLIHRVFADIQVKKVPVY
ncbi:MAG: hypothetical protein WC489_08415 [Patescibacteria group bacterium]